MPRPLWKGAISFSMVTIPIKLYSATEEKDVRFNMLHATDGSRIKQKRFCAEEDIEVDNEEIVKGYEISPGHYVTLEPSDLEAVAVQTTRMIDILGFVDLTEIDPIMYQKTYYLEPDEIGKKSYGLLVAALEDQGKVAIAKVAMRQKEQLCTLRTYNGVIALETMFYADEVRSTKDLEVPNVGKDVSDKDLAMARILVDSMTMEFEPEQYKDEYREGLLDIIRKKAEGETIEAPAPAPAKITDLTEALRASVEAAQKRKKEPETVGASSRSKRKAS
jgi:DNA end-binding protein Ku